MVFIEWANLFTEVLPKNYFEITIKLIDENIREFELIKHE
jgi:tRNA A37 threonylcarbamoyladenosine biosynthesis protein TsaE